MTNDELPVWGRAVPVQAPAGRGWHRALAVVLGLDLLLPLTALTGVGPLSDTWWLVLVLLVVRYGLLLGGGLVFLVHGVSCERPGPLCGGPPDDGRMWSGLVAGAVGFAGFFFQVALAGAVVVGVLFLGGEPMRSAYLAVAGRTVQAHVVRAGPSCVSAGGDDRCGRLVLAGPDGTPLGSVDLALVEAVRGGPVPESRVSPVPSGTSPDLPVATDPLGLIEPQPIGADGRVAVRHPVLGALLAGEWLAALGLLVALVRPRRRSRRREGSGGSVAQSEAKIPSSSTDGR